MIRNNRIYIGIVTIWLLMLGGALSPVQAYQPVQTYQPAQQPSAWRTKPVMSNELYPEYHFQSTSTYTPVVGKTTYTTTETYNPFETSSPRRARSEYDPWNDTDPSEELPLGDVDDPAPIGSPLVLLVLAMLYLLKKNIVLISKSTNFKKILKK